MKEKLNYLFADGVELRIILGEDGYTVNVMDMSRPLIGTFTSFENMLYGIAPILQEKIDSIVEMECFAMALNVNFRNNLSESEIMEIIMK